MNCQRIRTFAYTWFRHRKARICDSAANGFTLLELSICLSILALSATITSIWITPVVARHTLAMTGDQVVWTMRWCQQDAITHATDSNFALAPYSPEYTVYLGPTPLFHAQFPQDVNYRDGYLSLSTGTVRYAPNGLSTVSGVIQLVDGMDGMSIELYMGSGLQVEGSST